MLKLLVKESQHLFSKQLTIQNQSQVEQNLSNINKIVQSLNLNQLGQELKKCISNQYQPKMWYVSVVECPFNTHRIGVFIINKNQQMPLHDHPNMYVCTKVFYGKAKIQLYDIEGDKNVQHMFPYNHYVRGLQMEKVNLKSQGEKYLESGQIHWTFPYSSNLHSFKNDQNDIFAFLDVIVPNYDFDQNRCCNFYEKNQEGGEKEFKITGFPADYDMETLEVNLDWDKYFNIAR